jgi:hypothetical protein
VSLSPTIRIRRTNIPKFTCWRYQTPDTARHACEADQPRSARCPARCCGPALACEAPPHPLALRRIGGPAPPQPRRVTRLACGCSPPRRTVPKSPSSELVLPASVAVYVGRWAEGRRERNGSEVGGKETTGCPQRIFCRFPSTSLRG